MSESTPLRVAIADDVGWMRDLLARMVRHLGHEVVAATEDGESLIAECAALEPDVVIVDDVMPDMLGTSAAAIIYEHRPTQIILLSECCDHELVSDAGQKHVVMYLWKPVHMAHLNTALERCRERADAQLAYEAAPSDWDSV